MKKIKVVLLEPMKKAKIIEIDNNLESLQKIVQGLIEPVYFFKEPVCLICNEEGKINNMQLNRAVYDEDTNELLDIIAGPAIICDASGDDFDNLNDKQLAYYMNKFMYPESFHKDTSGNLMIVQHR